MPSAEMFQDALNMIHGAFCTINMPSATLLVPKNHFIVLFCAINMPFEPQNIPPQNAPVAFQIPFVYENTKRPTINVSPITLFCSFSLRG